MNTFQLPDETHVSRVQLRTANLKRLVTFYQDVIGFRVIDRGEAEASLSETGSAPAILVLNEESHAKPRPHRATGLYHFAIRYPTLDLEKRLDDHLMEQACRTTELDPPVAVLRIEICPTFPEARRREAQLKRWSRALWARPAA
jgi:catechol-2,3-dioxygenase